MKKLYLVPLCILLVAAIALAGCAQQAPAPKPAPTTAPAPAPAPAPTTAPSPTTPAAVKPIILRLASQLSPASDVAQVNKRWADMIEQQSGGRLKIQLYFSESLAKQSEILRAAQTGVAHLVMYNIGTDPSLQPLTLVTKLPFIELPSQSAASSIHWELIKKFPEVEKEFQGTKIVSLAAFTPDLLHFTKKEVRVPADMKGMKIIARGGEWPNTMKLMGVAAIELGAGDWYISLNTGLAEGQVIPFTAARSFKLLDLLKYHTIFGEGGCSTTMSAYLINSDIWNGLAPDLQKIISDTGKWQEDEIMKTDAAGMQKAIDDAKAAKHTFTNLKPDEIQSWFDTVKPIYDKWITDNQAKGLPAKAVFDETVRLIKQYTK